MIKKIFIVMGLAALLMVATALAIAFFYKDNMQEYQAKAIQAEAKTNLSYVFTILQAHHIENNSFKGATLASLGWEENASTQRYKLELSELADETFMIHARSPGGDPIECMTEDVWSIDQDQKVTHVKNGYDSCK